MIPMQIMEMRLLPPRKAIPIDRLILLDERAATLAALFVTDGQNAKKQAYARFPSLPRRHHTASTSVVSTASIGSNTLAEPENLTIYLKGRSSPYRRALIPIWWLGFHNTSPPPKLAGALERDIVNDDCRLTMVPIVAPFMS